MRLPALTMMVLLAFMATSQAAPIAVTTISFDQLQSGEDVLGFYNGGSGSLGTGPGPLDGVIFGPGWIVGPPDTYSIPGGNSARLSGPAIMNVPAGWSGMFSFYYSGGALSVNFYSGTDGSGALVESLSLVSKGTFYPAGGNFPSAFQSAVFNANGNVIDAVTFGAQVIPEPAALEMFLLGLGVVSLVSGLSRKRSAARR